MLTIQDALDAYSGACGYRFRGDVDKDSGRMWIRIPGMWIKIPGDVNTPNRDERGGVEPGLILTFLDQAF